MTTRLEAKEEIHTLARRLIDEATAEVLMTALPDSRKFRDGVEEAEIPVGGYYTITTAQTLLQPRAGVGSIRDATAATYEAKGQVLIKVCGAKSEGDAYYNIDCIAERLQDLFNERRSDSATSSLLFTNARVKDDERQSGQWYQIYMVAEWECEGVRTRATG
jgi:hypothetical protein